MTKESVLSDIKALQDKLKSYHETVGTLNLGNQYTVAADKPADYLNEIEELVKQHDLSVNYLSQFQQDISNLSNHFAQIPLPISPTLDGIPLINYESHFFNALHGFDDTYDRIVFNLNFFQKTGFLKTNIVAVGANGSGKTSLTNKFKTYIQPNSAIISAQRILYIPIFDSINNPDTSALKLRELQSKPNITSSPSALNSLQGEFGVVIQNLLANNITVSTIFRSSAIKAKEEGYSIDPPETTLDKTLNIWNSLIEHRLLKCLDGMNLSVIIKDSGIEYNANQMSEGEKVMLFLIAQVLQAPKSGFIIIDEPEMYLHKTIVSKLWDILEYERKDCIFIYLTHDLDFASSRIAAQKIWIKSFTYPDKWDIEVIPKNELPEPLLLQLLGSRKSILFCEGKKGSIDERIYNILFPNYTVTPVENCFAVMNYTKAFNKLPNSTTKAFGIIDADYHDKARLAALEIENVFSFSMVEPENLLLDETFITLLAKYLYKSSEDIEHIKDDIIKQLQTDIIQQVSNYVSSKVNYYFKNSHQIKGNTLEVIQKNHAQFIQDNKIEEWFEQREKELNAIIQAKDYQKALSVFNNKGLKGIAIKHLSTTDFQNTALRFLEDNPAAQEALKQHFKNFINAQASQ